MARVGFIGRFQPLHQGHHQVIEEYREEFDELVVVVGSSDKSREGENPLSFKERRDIIHDCFPDIEVVGLEDTEFTEEGNRKWAENLKEMSDADAVISQNDLVKRLVEEHTDMDVVEQELHEKDIYSGTEIRRRVRSGEEWRYLVPDCSVDKVEEFLEIIRDAGEDYEFEPGWKKENAYHGTAED